jgi:aspartokinase-like uncharacterized kinase
MEWVVKIGGSLFPEHAIKLATALENTNSILICGGGVLANLIREYDANYNFSATANHWAAIKCMDILGSLVADKIDHIFPVHSLEEAKIVKKNGQTPLLLPYHLLYKSNPLKHSWGVTSDSIALYIAHLLKAKLLISTDVDGIYTKEPSLEGAQFLRNINTRKLLNFGETSVDRNFAELLFKYPTPCYVVNGKYPERVLSIMEGKSSIYTLIGGKLNG